MPLDLKRPPCLHKKAKYEGRCKSCGAPTKSHPLEETVMRKVQCPDCGLRVAVSGPAYLCHKCFSREGEAASPVAVVP